VAGSPTNPKIREAICPVARARKAGAIGEASAYNNGARIVAGNLQQTWNIVGLVLTIAVQRDNQIGSLLQRQLHAINKSSRLSFVRWRSKRTLHC
jgi:hypothetical protein